MLMLHRNMGVSVSVFVLSVLHLPPAYSATAEPTGFVMCCQKLFISVKRLHGCTERVRGLLLSVICCGLSLSFKKQEHGYFSPQFCKKGSSLDNI